MRSGTVEGVEDKYVKNILLDTGCSRNLVHRKLVPEEAFLDGRATYYIVSYSGSSGQLYTETLLGTAGPVDHPERGSTSTTHSTPYY